MFHKQNFSGKTIFSNSLIMAAPKPIRDGMNLNPGDKITIVVENDKIYIKKALSNKD